MSKYKRLTTKCEVGIGLTETSGNIVKDYEKVVNRLAELEDKIENGTLIELPCKVGDVVYFVYETDNDKMFIDKGLIESFSYDEAKVWFRAIYENLSSYWHTVLSIGDTVFLTKAEAETWLKKLQES